MHKSHQHPNPEMSNDMVEKKEAMTLLSYPELSLLEKFPSTFSHSLMLYLFYGEVLFLPF